jgi:hypothetical protein
MGFIISPFLSPFAFGFLVARAKSVSPFLHEELFLTVVCTLVGDGHMGLDQCTAHSFFSSSSSLGARRKSIHPHHGPRPHESRMYDRGVKNLPPRPTGGLRYRFETLVGITGSKMATYRAAWVEAISAPFKLFWRPHLFSILVFEVSHYPYTEFSPAVN